MPFDFTDNQPEVQYVQHVEETQVPVWQMTEEQPEQDPEDQFSEVERRLQLAQYYRLLLNDTLFAAPSVAGAQVEAEIRAFVHERLSTLVGLRPEPVAPVRSQVQEVFSEDEIEMLKGVAEQLLKTKASAARAKAQAGQVRAPEVKKKAESPAVKEQPKPALKKARVEPEVQKPVPQVQPEPAKVPKQRQPKGEVRIPMSRIIPEYRTDPTLTFKKGRAWVAMRDEDGVVLVDRDGFVVAKDVTLPATPVGIATRPMPGKDEYTQLQAKAAEFNSNAQSRGIMAGGKTDGVDTTPK